MSLQIQIPKKNLIIKVYCFFMALFMILRYVFHVDVPSAAFLLVAVIPAFFGSVNELLACMVSYIPLSVAFQYKYALYILMAAMLLKNRWRIKSGYAILLVLSMMVWELLHFGYGYFSIVEYIRDFPELLFMGALMMIDVGEPDYKMIIRSLSISVVGVCVIMLVMQLQQFNFNLPAVFSRSASSWRFGQSNMDSGRFALNFNANNLGFICNLSASGLLMLRKRKENVGSDLALTIASLFFALITLSRAAIVCMLMLIVLYSFGGESRGVKRAIGIVGLVAVIGIAGITIYTYVPSVFENLLERFRRKDVWNGRGSLLTQYMKFAFMSPDHLLFGIGMQGIFEKVSSVIWVHDVPHNGLQEVLIAWGLPGLAVMIVWIGMIVVLSKVHSCGKRDFYQFMPLLLTVVFTMSGQFLTSSRAIMALSFSYVCLCMASTVRQKEEPAADEGKL